MTDTRPLTTLLDLQKRARDAALLAHRREQAASVAAQTQLEQLRSYRREYEQRWSAQFREAGAIELVRCYHAFMQRLDQAVEQQQRVAEHVAQCTAQALATLRQRELQCASVRLLIERRAQALRLAGERREQKQTDEQAARAAWSRVGAGARALPL